MSATTASSQITRVPHRCGGVACIRDTRITVWGLVSWRRQGVSDDALQEMIPGLSTSDLLAAWTYAEENAEEIEEQIRRNETTEPEA